MPFLDMTLTFPDSGAAGFQVHGYESSDALNEIFEIRLEVSNTDAELDVTTVVGEKIEVSIPDEVFVKRRRGVVRRVRQLTSEPTGTSRFELIVVPAEWYTTRRSDNRIFQNKSADVICEEVLALYDGRIPALEKAISKPEPREYRVQYDETDHDFLFRILAEEGITTFFDEDVDGAFNLVDDIRLLQANRGDVPFIPPAGSGATQTNAHVLSVAITSDIETSKVTVRDFDFSKPNFKLDKNKTTKEKTFTKEANLERYEFLTSRFSTSKEQRGEAIAEQFLDEARSLSRTLECKTSFFLAPGSSFTLIGHPRPEVNGELRVVRSHMVRSDAIAGRPEIREYTLLCITVDRPFHPARHARPRIFGTHVATVVGEKAGAAEIDIDDRGRVKVEFHWDRRDLHLGNPTRFVRVSQGWAGGGYGMVLHPRVGNEVIIAYLDGDPDEPMIIGRLHNALNVSPLTTPAEKTKSIWRSQTSPSGDGHNEIMMEDQQGRELLEFHAQRDNLFTVNAQQDIDVGAKRNDHVKGDLTEKYDSNQTITVGGMRVDTVTGTVTENYGPRTTDIFGPMWETAAATTIKYASLDTTIEGMHHEKFGTIHINGGAVTASTIGTVTINSQNVDWMIGGTTLTMSPGNITMTSPEIRLNADAKITLDAPEVHNTSPSWKKTGVISVESMTFKESTIGQKLEVVALAISLVSGLKVDVVGAKMDNASLKMKASSIDLGTRGMAIAQGAVSILTAGLAKIG